MEGLSSSRELKALFASPIGKRENPNLKFHFSIRFKIVLLIIAALAISLLSFLSVGTSLMVEDKVSYIYDYTLAEVKSVSDKIDARLQKTSSVGQMMTNVVRSLGPEGVPAPAQALYDQYATELGIGGLLILRPLDADHFKIEFALGDGGAPGPAHYNTALAQLGWTPAAFEKEALLVGPPIQLGSGAARIPIGVRGADAEGKPLAFFSLCNLEQAIVQEGSKNYEIRLIDSFGKTLLSKSASLGTLTPGAFDGFVKNLIQGTFDSGVRDWNWEGQEYITAYQRLASRKLTVVSLISKDTAFLAAKQLVVRSLVLGLSILFVAIGLTLLLVRPLTRRLREMWEATRKVGEGDFSIRVNADKLPRDEVGGLALSFNAMADKIGELMLQTAQNARMEKELETAQAVQRLFFPAQAFEHAVIKLSGQYVPASECAGDWWHYSRMGTSLVVVIGDVTGHGVSAALVTAAAHSTFILLMKQFSAGLQQSSLLEALVSGLNSSVLAAAGGQSTMTFVVSVIDLSTGLMTMSNASHPPLYIYRKPKNPAEQGSPLSYFKPIMDGRIASLGEAEEIRVESSTYQLEPGDKIFWYTDGIIESRPSDGQKMGKKSFLNLLASRSETDAPEEICGGVMKEVLGFFGVGATDRPDDITLVVAAISEEARFDSLGPGKYLERAIS